MSKTNPTRRGRIETRHRDHCRSHGGGRCNCRPSYRARVVDPVSGRRHWSKTMHDPIAAERWLADALRALDAGVSPGRPNKTTVAEHIHDLLERMRDGRALDRSGGRYRPSTIRSYEIAAERYVKPKLGHMRIDAVRRRDVQDLVDELRVRGLAPSTVHNKLDVLRVVFRHALRREEVAADPCTNLDLPSVRSKPKRVADPARAEALLDALPEAERALWTTLFYAGLRVGEARALRWSDVDFDADELRVERGWDDIEGEMDDPKTEAGRRTIPLSGRLRAELRRHKLASGRGGDDLIFGRTATEAFDRATMRRRARKAWKAADLEPLTPHECRHTCASYLIAAGVNDMQLTRYIGHTDVRTTKNIYGHLFPDDAQRVRAALDAYLEAER
jgi:integrase